MITPEVLAGGIVLVVALLVVVIVLLCDRAVGQAIRDEGQAVRAGLGAVQQALVASHRAESEQLRSAVVSTERALTGRAEAARLEDKTQLNELSLRLLREQGEQRVLLETKLREMADQAALRLAEIQRSVNEKLTESIEKQMQGSFQRVIDQFAAVQKAMGDVQAVTAQIGDLKRIFTNVKTRGAGARCSCRRC